MSDTESTTATEAPAVAGRLDLGLGLLPERWYVLDADGLATLCKDEADAREAASGYWSLYPRRGPYRAVLLGDVAAERELAVRVLADVLGTSGTPMLHQTREEDARALLRLARERA